MNHEDHVALIQDGITQGGIWADLGSGRGAFTLALADCLGAGSRIYSVDVDRRALDAQKIHMSVQFPQQDVEYIQGDFTKKLDLPALDGILMANALHFVQAKLPVIQMIRDMLQSGGRLVLVEYDTDDATLYVPHPLSYPTWVQLASEAGFSTTRQLATRPSSNMGRIFSALSRKEAAK